LTVETKMYSLLYIYGTRRTRQREWERIGIALWELGRNGNNFNIQALREWE